jgi:putative thioredoxin
MSMPWVVEVTRENVEAEVLNRSFEKPVVVDFHAEWCQPCKMLGPLLEKLTAEHHGAFILAKVDIDRNQELARMFGVESIPHVVALGQGNIIDEFVGMVPEPALRQFLERVLPNPLQQLCQEAAGLEVSDPARAETLYSQALALDPSSTVALAGLAALRLEAGKLDEVEPLLAKIGEGTDGWERSRHIRTQLKIRQAAADAGPVSELEAKVAAEPGNLDARLELGKVYAASGRIEEALETMAKIAEENMEFGASRVRPEMVAIFQEIGQASELANRYRTRLMSALY